MQEFTATLSPAAALTAVLSPSVAVPGPPGPAGPVGPAGPQGPAGIDFTSQAVLTGSRVANVAYQNTTGKGMLVSTSWDLAGKTTNLVFYSDAANPPVTEVARIANPSPQTGVVAQVFTLVLAGHWYQCSEPTGSAILIVWVEYT
jgi:hypothetical protein